jgi:hypothetical protein
MIFFDEISIALEVSKKGSVTTLKLHKSLKSNASLAKSPTKTIKTQANHVFMAIYSVFKLECLKIKTALNHFALRTKLLIRANQMAFMELQRLKDA